MDADQKRRGAVAGVGGDGASPGPATYPREAVEWLVGTGPARVLELAAGAGNLTAVLCDHGLEVVAVDASPGLVADLRRALPEAHVAVARADDLPLAAASVEIVVVAAFPDLDPVRSLPEIARVLRPGGVFAVIRSSGDHKVPWVRRMLSLVGTDAAPAPADPFETSDLFKLTERRSFRRWQRFDRSTLVGFVAASPKAATLSPGERDDLLAQAGELYDGYGRGPDGMLMPWTVDCYRARVKGLSSVVTTSATDDALLIDFS